MQNSIPGPGLTPEFTRWRDNEHLKLLSIFHYVLAGLCAMGLAFLCVHFLFFHFVMSAIEQDPKQAPPPEFFRMFIWFYLYMGLLCAGLAVINLLSAVFLRRQAHRVFSLVVAGLDCLQVPYGTVLGVFTIVVLTRNSVRKAYEAREAAVWRAS